MENRNDLPEVINDALSKMMEFLLSRVKKDDFYIEEQSRFVFSSLLPQEVYRAAHLNGFVPSVFNEGWKGLFKELAVLRYGNGSVNHSISGNVGLKSLRRIQEVLNRFSMSTAGKELVLPDWDKEINYIKTGGGQLWPINVSCDFFIKDEPKNLNYVFILVDNLANSFKIRECKERLLKIASVINGETYRLYYVLPFDMNVLSGAFGWNVLSHWFNPQKDTTALLAEEFWNLVGGEGTFSDIKRGFSIVGEEYRTRVLNEVFSIK